MRISVEPAPLLFASGQGGYLAGGTQTESYRNVAVIMLEGLPHCTATLVAPDRLITAAHCVVGHMTRERLDAGKVTAGFGSVYSQPLFAPIQVVKADYPDSGEVIFDPRTLKHDIAVLYLKSAVKFQGISPSVLHEGSPSWQQVKSKGTKLVFVGFGFNVINNEKVGLGIKREAAWGISDYDDHAISFSVPGTSTCRGDSGGPGFIESSQALILAAITSGGDEACTYGFDMRVDAYLGWLKPRIGL
jgi:secreted trypsin-like serine protease